MASVPIRARAWAIVAVALTAVVVVAGCTSSGANGPILDPTGTTSESVSYSPLPSMTEPSAVSTSTAVSTSPASQSSEPPTTSVSSTPTPASSPSSSSSPTATLSAAEAADRKAAEQAWLDFQDVGDDLWKKPAKSWRPTLEKYAVEPILTRSVKSLQDGAAAGKGNWGTAGHDIYWQIPIDGAITATMGDCMDTSTRGAFDTKAGKKLSRGVPHDNTQVSLVRTSAGWKVADFRYLVNVPCPGQSLTPNEEASSLAASASSSKVSSTRASS